LIAADLLQPAHVLFNVGPAHPQRIQVVAGAPVEIDFQVLAGVQLGLTLIAAQVSGSRRVENTLVRSRYSLIGSSEGSHDPRSGVADARTNALGAAEQCVLGDRSARSIQEIHEFPHPRGLRRPAEPRSARLRARCQFRSSRSQPESGPRKLRRRIR
jgi:hypothetical protein